MKSSLVILAICVLQSGCASIMSLSGDPDTYYDEDYAKQIYGGTKLGWEYTKFMAKEWPWFCTIPCVVDLPLSATVDTIALPYTVPYNIAKNNKNSNQSIEPIVTTPVE